jgi:GNAT superfamily N-acetyltransferase
VIIRDATEHDVPQILPMAARFLASTPYGQLLPTEPERLEAFVRAILAIGVAFVAEDHGGALVGMIAFVVAEHPISGQEYADEQAWWVSPECRGGSIGPKLLHAAEAWARQRGLTMVKMVAPVASEGVAAYYERIGYEAVEVSYVKQLAP